MGGFSLKLEDDGCLAIWWNVPLPFNWSRKWSSGTHVKEAGEKRFISGTEYDVQYRRRMSMSLRGYSGVSQEASPTRPARIPDEQVWIQSDWFQDGILMGSVFRNKKAGTALRSAGYETPAFLSDYVNNCAIWVRGDFLWRSDDVSPVHPIADLGQNLGFEDDSSYPAGTLVSIQPWTEHDRQAKPNLVWTITDISDPR